MVKVLVPNNINRALWKLILQYPELKPRNFFVPNPLHKNLPHAWARTLRGLRGLGKCGIYEIVFREVPLEVVEEWLEAYYPWNPAIVGKNGDRVTVLIASRSILGSTTFKKWKIKNAIVALMEKNWVRNQLT